MKANNKEASTKKSETQADYEIQLPTEANIAKIAQDMRLSAEQAAALQHAVCQAFSQIGLYKQKNHSPEKRKDLIARMRNLEKVLAKLDYEINRSKSYMSDYLLFDALEMIGLRAPPAFIKEVLGEKGISSSIDRQIGSEFAEKGKVDLVKIGSFLRPVLQAVGLKHGPELFGQFIKDLLTALVTWRLLNADGSKNAPPSFIANISSEY